MGIARWFPAAVASVYDGDTVRVSCDLGMDVWRYVNARLVIDAKIGINCIELKDPGGREARARVLELAPPGSPVTTTAYRWDKYGNRLDCQIMLPGGRNLAQMLVDEGYAVAWDGTGARPVPTWPIPGR